MMEKKRMAALLAAVLFGMSAIPAGAVNLIDTDAAATDSAEHAELDLYGVRATVTDRQDGELTVSTETAGTVVVHIAEQTIIMDTQTGLPAGAQDIKKGDEVYLYCGEMMALSEPPQVYAKAILVNLSDESFEIKPGERIAQLVVARFERAEWESVETLGETARGEGGMGSTGRG